MFFPVHFSQLVISSSILNAIIDMIISVLISV